MPAHISRYFDSWHTIRIIPGIDCSGNAPLLHVVRRAAAAAVHCRHRFRHTSVVAPRASLPPRRCLCWSGVARRLELPPPLVPDLPLPPLLVVRRRELRRPRLLLGVVVGVRRAALWSASRLAEPPRRSLEPPSAASLLAASRPDLPAAARAKASLPPRAQPLLGATSRTGGAAAARSDLRAAGAARRPSSMSSDVRAALWSPPAPLLERVASAEPPRRSWNRHMRGSNDE
ncbi:hypothetical protein Scep_012045 [Stephania cephalantha]|uniref:Uncharacterized protein n=1 Tax=Stephania cephalantha TaxID=152367 RepID=A0AAP0P652_9MAGN